MAGFQSCSDISDAKPFYPKRHLYLKPLLKINISIQLPSLKLVGKSISNVILMDHIRDWALPDKFCSIKVTKSTLEFIRFEADLLNPTKVQAILARLDGKHVTLPGFKEMVKIRASIAKLDCPSRHDWDSFFRDAKHMNEMKAGERPDTLHLSDLPNKWFSTKFKEDLPSESLLKKIFQQFGEVTAVDIPSVDPYRSKMKAHLSGLKLFNFNQNTTFEAYVQFRDYISFVKAMDYLRGMKLLRIESDQAYMTTIQVDFDKTKHLSESSIRKRKIEREKLMAKDRELEEKKLKLEEKEREEKKTLNKFPVIDKKAGKNVSNNSHLDDIIDNSSKIDEEKKLLLLAQRKLESIRLLTELFRMIKESKDNIVKESPKNSETRADSNDSSFIDLEDLSPVIFEDESNNFPEFTDSQCAEGNNQKISKETKVDHKTSEKTRVSSKVIKIHHKSAGYKRSYDGCEKTFKGNNFFQSKTWRKNRRNNQRNFRDMRKSNINSFYGNTRYDYNTHHLYYKYFQSLTRNGSSSESHSRNCSKSPNNDEFSSGKSSRTRSKLE
ncbi:hypothetical protein O3M35_008558 [Rhynocoris fuscipes]|uniref:RRM domain-containing protein n=1 Tax=Rhynocoris fuscipes TaxID=488301 RepID=A0AAW1D7G0_9HEMI